MAYPIVDSSEKKMNGAIEHLREDLLTIRTGMANAGMLNKVNVDYYGSPTPESRSKKAEHLSSNLMIRPA